MEWNFNINNAIDSLGTTYDYSSVMHYTNKAFSKNRLRTIRAKGGVSQRKRVIYTKEIATSDKQDRQTNRQTDKQTDRHTDRQISRQTERHWKTS